MTTTLAQRQPVDRPEGSGTVDLQLNTITYGESVRSSGLDQTQVALLAELEGYWPPILVWGKENLVIDGAHRIAAAHRLGHTRIVAIRFSGTAEEARIEAVRRNIQHGLPLTLEDRRRAARWILSLHSEWSDRRIAGLCGLSGKTVARLRGEVPGSTPDSNGVVIGLNSRVGRDGRSRPVQAQESRARILQALEENPQGSLRTIAAVAGTSPETVRRVRARLAAEEPHGERDQEPAALLQIRPSPSIMRSWEADPALSASEDISEFTRWFTNTDIESERWRGYVGAIPVGRIYEVADEARRRSTCWGDFAKVLEDRVRR